MGRHAGAHLTQEAVNTLPPGKTAFDGKVPGLSVRATGRRKVFRFKAPVKKAGLTTVVNGTPQLKQYLVKTLGYADEITLADRVALAIEAVLEGRVEQSVVAVGHGAQAAAESGIPAFRIGDERRRVNEARPVGAGLADLQQQQLDTVAQELVGDHLLSALGHRQQQRPHALPVLLARDSEQVHLERGGLRRAHADAT